MQPVDLPRKGPSHSLRVQTLDILASPHRRPHWIQERLPLGRHDRRHHSVVHECAEDRAPYLGDEQYARRDLEVLSHFEIACEADGGADYVL